MARWLLSAGQCLALSFTLSAGAAPNALPCTTPTTTRAMTLTLSPASVVGGVKVTGTVALGTEAPPGGTPVTLTSSAIAIAGLAAPSLGPRAVVSMLRLIVPAGENGLTFEIHTSPVASLSQVTIGAATRTESVATILTVALSDSASRSARYPVRGAFVD